MTESLSAEYNAALAQHLAGEGEPALQRAYELGRRAMAEGTSLLDLVSVHHQALQQALSHDSPRGQSTALVAAGHVFLTETLSPFEMVQGEIKEAITALRCLNQMLEEEARRIAQALHDDAAQLLASVYMSLDQVACDYPRLRGRLQEVRELLDGVEKQLRRLSHELRPPVLDSLGLVPALEFLAQGVSARTGIPIEIEGPRGERLPTKVETAVYRVVQEALTNATRHAQPSRVRVTMRREPRRLTCNVRDDGKGFEATTAGGRMKSGLGLSSMRERLNALAGHLTIDSAPGRGTMLEIDVPLEEADVATSSARG